MEIIFAPKALADIKYWKTTGNIRVQKKITELLNSIFGKTTPSPTVNKHKSIAIKTSCACGYCGELN